MSSAESIGNSNVESNSSVKELRLPVSLQIVAYLTMLIGVINCLEICFEKYHSSDSLLDFLAALLLFAGWGLFRLREWARLFVAYFTVMCVSIGIVLLAIPYAPLKIFSNSVLPSTSQLFGIPLATCYVWWQYRVLYRPDIVALFKSARNSKFRPIFPVRFRLTHLLIFMTLASLAMFRLIDDQHYYHGEMGVFSRNSNGERVNVTYYYRQARLGGDGMRLDYVVFDRDSGYSTSLSSTFFPPLHLASSCINLPNGETIKLPNECQLFELADGELRRSPARVTYEELQDYLALGDSPESLEDLLKFAEEQREKTEQP